jgi:hypothetical protein
MFLIFCISPVAFGDTTWGSIGFITDTDGASLLSFAYGQRWDWIGLEAGGAYYFNTLGEINDYPCPHTDYTIIAEQQKTSAFGLDVLFFADLDSISLYAGPGCYLFCYREVSESNVTNWLYAESKGLGFLVTCSLGIQTNLNDDSVAAIGYHTLRGWNIQFSTRM